VGPERAMENAQKQRSIVVHGTEIFSDQNSDSFTLSEQLPPNSPVEKTENLLNTNSTLVLHHTQAALLCPCVIRVISLLAFACFDLAAPSGPVGEIAGLLRTALVFCVSGKWLHIFHRQPESYGNSYNGGLWVAAGLPWKGLTAIWKS